MTLYRFLRSPRHGLPLLVVLTAVGAWFMSPRLRIALRDVQPSAIATVQRVDAHRYDGAWFDAARVGRVDILDALLDAGYPIDATTSSGYTATILAAYRGQRATLDRLLARGADPCIGDRNGNTALMGALYKGDADMARRLLSTHCAIDQANNAGQTALSFAMMFGRLDMLPLVVERGADPSHRDRQGDTPYRVAEKQGNAEAVQALRRVIDDRSRRTRTDGATAP